MGLWGHFWQSPTGAHIGNSRIHNSMLHITPLMSEVPSLHLLC